MRYVPFDQDPSKNKLGSCSGRRAFMQFISPFRTQRRSSPFYSRDPSKGSYNSRKIRSVHAECLQAFYPTSCPDPTSRNVRIPYAAAYSGIPYSTRHLNSICTLANNSRILLRAASSPRGLLENDCDPCRFGLSVIPWQRSFRVFLWSLLYISVHTKRLLCKGEDSSSF